MWGLYGGVSRDFHSSCWKAEGFGREQQEHAVAPGSKWLRCHLTGYLFLFSHLFKVLGGLNERWEVSWKYNGATQNEKKHYYYYFLPSASTLSGMRHCVSLGCYFHLFTRLLLVILSGLLRSDINVRVVWKLMERQRFILRNYIRVFYHPF